MYNKITNYNMTRNKYWEQRKTYYDEPIYKPRGFVDHPILSELRYDTSPVYVDNPVSSSCEHIYKPNTFVDNLMSHELRYDTSPVYVENNKRRHFEPIYTMRGGGSDLDQTIINQYIQHKKNNKKDYEQLYRILAQKVNVEKHPERKQDTKMSKATNDILHVSQQALTHISKSKEETNATDDILRLAQQALTHAPVSSQEAHAQTKEETNATDDILRLAQQALSHAPVSSQEAHAPTKEETNATDDILRLAQQALTHAPTKEETKATDVITSQQETTSASVASASVASAPAEENTTSPPQKNDVLTPEDINTLKDNLLINKNVFTRKFGKIMSNWPPYLNFMKEELKKENINLPEPNDSNLKYFFTAHKNLKKNYKKVKGVFDTKTLSDNDKEELNEELNKILSQYTQTSLPRSSQTMGRPVIKTLRASTTRKVQHRKNLDKSIKPPGTAI